MRVAICDDENIAVEMLHEQLKEIKEITQIRTFLSSADFLSVVENGEWFDIVFMDIDWKEEEKTGIDFAADLLKLSPLTQIIYVTGYNDRFSQQIFLKNANLCGFLIKPVNMDTLLLLLEKAKENMVLQEEEKLIVKENGIVHAIPYQEISYFESAGRKLVIFTLDDKIEIYEKLDDLRKKLPEGFLQCHKSFLVNMNHIRRIDKNFILLKNGAEVPISRAKYAETRERYFRYMGETL